MVDKKVFNTADLFKGKTVPPFIKGHHILSSPVNVSKVFPGIGLSNFREETNITRCVTELKKDGSYVWNILQDISSECGRAKDLISLSSQKTQFLASLEERLAKKAKLNEVAQVVVALAALQESCDPRSTYAFHATNGVVNTNAGKIDLRLHSHILNGEGKIIHKAGLPVFRLYKQLRDKCIEHGVLGANIALLDTMPSYKTFSKENIPNKKFEVVFSSEGSDGAWDLLTMSMRGIRSCQRWGGEYPKCLIGSVLSRYVAIMYLTSGVEAEATEGYENLGTKMMRRSVVRYAIDRDENKPCLVIDKMYPSEDDEVLKVFTEILAKKSKLEVHYGPRLGLRTRHIYLPNDKITDVISRREWSYQDTALRTKCELDAHILTHNQSEIEKHSQRIQSNFAQFLSIALEDIEHNNDVGMIDLEIKKIVSNLTLSAPISMISELLTTAIFGSFIPPKPTNYYSIRVFNRDFLKTYLAQRKDMIYYSKARIDSVLKTHCSREYSVDAFSKLLSEVVVKFIRKELSQSFSR